METVYDLLDGLPADAALRAPPAAMTAREVQATAYRTGNYLRAHGVHRGSPVGVVDDRRPKPLFAVLGATLLAAPVRFDPPRDFDGRAVVAPTDALDDYELGPGGQRIGYGAKPASPADAHFEGGVWSENPAFPPVAFDGDVPVLAGADDPSQRELLAAATRRADALDADDVLAVRAPLASPATLAAVLGAFAAGATVLLPDDAVGTVAVADGDAPEDRTV